MKVTIATAVCTGVLFLCFGACSLTSESRSDEGSGKDASRQSPRFELSWERLLDAIDSERRTLPTESLPGDLKERALRYLSKTEDPFFIYLYGTAAGKTESVKGALTHSRKKRFRLFASETDAQEATLGADNRVVVGLNVNASTLSMRISFPKDARKRWSEYTVFFRITDEYSHFETMTHEDPYRLDIVAVGVH